MKRRLFSLLVLLLCLTGTVQAAGLTGSIRLTAPAGGTVTLYRVAGIAGGEILPSEQFSLWNGGFGDLQSPEPARKLAQFTRDHGIPGTTKSMGREETVVFHDLEPGLYLLTQDTPAPGYYAMEPFLVTIPMRIGNDILYHVDANPKVTEKPAPSTGDKTNIPGLLLTLCFSIAALGIVFREKITEYPTRFR